MSWEHYIPKSVKERYKVYDYLHACAILANEFQTEFNEIIGALGTFKIQMADILEKGGNESAIPKRLSTILRPLGWKEDKLEAKVVVGDRTIRSDTHKIDYMKGRVALDMEWNSKDQTYDRDLYAFRSFHEFDKISVGILITRDSSLETALKAMGKGIKNKYGASTTTMRKLIPRLDARRNGGCPIVVFGITPKVIVDLKGQ